jgi:hypothetical protein
MSLYEKCEIGGPTSRELFERMHRELNLPLVRIDRVDPFDSSADPKLARVKCIQEFVVKLWHERIKPHTSKRKNLGLRQEDGTRFRPADVRQDITLSRSPSEAVKVLRRASHELISDAVARAWVEQEVTPESSNLVSPELFGKIRDLVESTKRLEYLQRFPEPVGVSERRDRTRDGLHLIVAGFNSLREFTWKTFGVVPAVAERYGCRILPHEQKEVCKNSLPWIYHFAKSHIISFEMTGLALRGDPTQDKPFDPSYFRIVRRPAGLTIEITRELIDDVLKSHPRVAGPRTGCPASPIIADMHHWAMEIATEYYFPEVHRLAQRPRPLPEPDMRDIPE